MEILEILIIFLSLFIFLIFSLIVIWYFSKNIKKTKLTSSQDSAQFIQSLSQDMKFLRDEIISMKTKTGMANQDLAKLRSSMDNVSFNQTENKIKLTNIVKKIQEIGLETKEGSQETKALSENIKDITKIFSSNYQRGSMGETTLYFIVESIFGTDSQIIQKQYLMKNGTRPDLFLKTNDNGIPIDSKFPYDNFVNLNDLNKKSEERKIQLSLLKKNIRLHIKVISEKYISAADNSMQAMMYIPSESLFQFIHSEQEFKDVEKFALEKKVILTSPNTLPMMLRLMLLYHENNRLEKSTKKIVKLLKIMDSDFNRFEIRWNKIERKMDGLTTETKNFSLTTGKIKNHFKNIIEINSSKNEIISSDDEEKIKIKEIK